MKVYTKKGDTGITQLIGGTPIPKHHLRIECYGTVDELNSFVGLVADLFTHAATTVVLKEIQERLFTLSASLASDSGKSTMTIPQLKASDVILLENEIDKMDAQLPVMKNFILPGGHVIVSYCHITRCVCRRAERLVSQLAEKEAVEPLVLKYLNRLSDYLFVLSRFAAKELHAEEITWKPRG